MATRLKASYFDAYFHVGSRRRRLPARFGVVTACNPIGKQSSLAENRRRDAALRRRLKALEITHFRVTGGNREGSHQEPGWGVKGSRAMVRALAAQFRQDAYFWIALGRVYLGSAAGGSLKRAGSWSARQRDWPRR